jgi:hypothetical protein
MIYTLGRLMNASYLKTMLSMAMTGVLSTSQLWSSFSDHNCKITFKHYPKEQTERVFNREVKDKNNIFNKGVENTILHWKATESDHRKSSASMISRQGSESEITTIKGKIFFPSTPSSEVMITFTFNEDIGNKNLFERGLPISKPKDSTLVDKWTEQVLDFKLIVNNSDEHETIQGKDELIKVRAQHYVLLIDGEFVRGLRMNEENVVPNTRIRQFRILNYSMGGVEFYLDDFGVYDGIQ